MRVFFVLAVALFLAGCESRPPGQCTFVSVSDLAVPRDGQGSTMICNSQRVNPGRVNRYFPTPP